MGSASLSTLCWGAMVLITTSQSPPLNDYILQAIDAGPGVGVSNVEVKYRDIEMSRINGWTHMNKIHRVPRDSGQNEAERSNAAIGEALVDGRALKWEFYKPTDIMGEKKLRNSLLLRSRSLRQKQWSESRVKN